MPPSPLSKFRTFCPSYKKFWVISRHTAFSHSKLSSHSVPSVSVGLSERPQISCPSLSSILPPGARCVDPTSKSLKWAFWECCSFPWVGGFQWL